MSKNSKVDKQTQTRRGISVGDRVTVNIGETVPAILLAWIDHPLYGWLADLQFQDGQQRRLVDERVFRVLPETAR